MSIKNFYRPELNVTYRHRCAHECDLGHLDHPGADFVSFNFSRTPSAYSFIFALVFVCEKIEINVSCIHCLFSTIYVAHLMFGE